MSTVLALKFDELLAPIPGANPAGQDVSLSAEYDKLKEARRADEDLAQGEWVAERKVAQWPLARDLAVQVLKTKSKDLQVAGWLTEAAAHLHGFPGLTSGLELLKGLLDGFWESLYPPMEGGDLEERAGRLVWMNTYLPDVIRAIPVTATGAGGYGWRHWQEAKDTDNLGRKSPEAMKAALADGKINSEIFGKAVAATPKSFYAGLYEEIGRCKEAVAALEKTVDERFGKDAPSFVRIREAVENGWKLASQIATEKGVLAVPSPAGDEQPGGEERGVSAGVSMKPMEGVGTLASAGVPQTRAEALRRLSEVAMYFKQTEPHSPVSYLVERAVRWGTMTLDQWLEDVIKEKTTLDNLHETLGLKPGGDS